MISPGRGENRKHLKPESWGFFWDPSSWPTMGWVLSSPTMIFLCIPHGVLIMGGSRILWEPHCAWISQIESDDHFPTVTWFPPIITCTKIGWSRYSRLPGMKSEINRECSHSGFSTQTNLQMIGANDCTINKSVAISDQKGDKTPSKVMQLWKFNCYGSSCHSSTYNLPKPNPMNTLSIRYHAFLGNGSRTWLSKNHPPQMHRRHFAQFVKRPFFVKNEGSKSNVNEGSRRSHMTYEYIFPKKQKMNSYI